MKFTPQTFKEIAELALSNERYNVYDLKLEHLTDSLTELRAGKETRGPKHENIEEVYMCLEGNGEMEIDAERFKFEKGDVVTIPLGAFHRVYNNSKKEMKFLAVFEKYERPK
ncbi:TPA: cupin domain-containing protein [archaeon]|uniref:Cupin domain-containing protein n=1 Tax=Candidatus Naiadarchaeum limnaeum TaxID=2756139 RepID=A0A832UMX7_9ARCH|nr:cupin domain-containing protein [Candidatus Naiadarchaeum limnaeum]